MASDDLGYPAGVPTWDEGIATLLGKLTGLVSEGHVTINDARVIQHLADRVRAPATGPTAEILAYRIGGGVYHPADVEVIRSTRVPGRSDAVAVAADMGIDPAVPMTITQTSEFHRRMDERARQTPEAD